jgi:hypothetical protein
MVGFYDGLIMWLIGQDCALFRSFFVSLVSSTYELYASLTMFAKFWSCIDPSGAYIP